MILDSPIKETKLQYTSISKKKRQNLGLARLHQWHILTLNLIGSPAPMRRKEWSWMVHGEETGTGRLRPICAKYFYTKKQTNCLKIEDMYCTDIPLNNDSWDQTS
jgi:hypothetical protein